MKITEFDFELDESLIAQVPIENRASSKLLVCDRKDESITHHTFSDIIDYLVPGDVLVINDTKVLPARLFGVKEETFAAIELLLLKNLEGDTWETMVKPARRVKIGTKISFGDGMLTATVLELPKDGITTVTFDYEGIFLERLEALGTMPLPPYIHEVLEDKDRYQTVYAKELGSVAAPTAGLHFTEELLQRIKNKGVKIASVTLHVGLGTFRPVQVDDTSEHKMHSEYYQMSEEAAALLNEAKRVIAVGTTSTRTLETIRQKHDSFVASSGWTDIFITPGYTFKAIDALITNFHLPKSTLVMLVSAFANREFIMTAYKEAMEHNYRFFSFGDAMFLK